MGCCLLSLLGVVVVIVVGGAGGAGGDGGSKETNNPAEMRPNGWLRYSAPPSRSASPPKGIMLALVCGKPQTGG